MNPSETMVGRIEEMYDPQRTPAILAQFNQAQESMNAGTLIGQLLDQSLEPGWYLNIHQNGWPERMERLSIGEHVIGRGPDCNIILGHICISRIHCMITLHTDGRMVLRDLQSANHVLVDGIQINPQERYEVSQNTKIYLSGACFITLKKLE